jgi:hypothetical protein
MRLDPLVARSTLTPQFGMRHPITPTVTTVKKNRSKEAVSFNEVLSKAMERHNEQWSPSRINTP